MESKRILVLKLLLVAVAAVVIAYYAVSHLRFIEAGMNVSDQGKWFVNHHDIHVYEPGPPVYITNRVEFINKACPYHLVSPTWNIPSYVRPYARDWFESEIDARIGIVAILWLTVSIFIFQRHFRNQKKP